MTTDPKAPLESAQFGFRSDHEHRLPATIAIIAAAAISLILPSNLTLGPKYLLPALEMVLLLALAISNPLKITRESKNIRALSISIIGLVNLSNAINLVLLSQKLISGSASSGKQLIYAAAAVWVTNTLVFSLWFWELDRGGPYARCSNLRRNPDFLFPQMTSPKSASDRWVPTFIDYLYVSFTNALAFSPTDTMPLTPMAKFLMLAQSLISVVTVVLVGARAVNILH
jgi:hypothetical protein